MTFWQAFRELFVYAVVRFPGRAAGFLNAFAARINRRIDLPGSRHLHASEQIRINPVPFSRRRRAALRVDGP